nr:hypothetical protein [Rhodovibrio sodomensis]
MARSFSQLSATMNRPANANPVTLRMTAQVAGSTKIVWISVAVEAIEASAANTRTCPTVPIIRGTSRLPARKPTKYIDMITPVALVANDSSPARTPSSEVCSPLPSIISATPRKSGQEERIAASMDGTP